MIDIRHFYVLKLPNWRAKIWLKSSISKFFKQLFFIPPFLANIVIYRELQFTGFDIFSKFNYKSVNFGSMKVQILTHQQVAPILKRIAYQIVESNSKAKEIYLVHIEGQGKALADNLENELHSITNQRIVRAGIQIDKKNPQMSTAHINGTIKPNVNSALVIVDDVLNSGKTMMCALSVCFNKGFDQIQVAVLVDRSYKHFPIQADFIGTSLSTTLQEHINVQCKDRKISVYVE